ncbi:hypothetical protein TWF281_002354 [Arthrobotrys megalospora]
MGVYATFPDSKRYRAQTDTFDTNPLLGGLLPVGDPIDKTAGGYLAYAGLQYTRPIVGLRPASPPNTASFGLLSLTVLSTSPKWFPINSTIISFDQKSIFYGCVQRTGDAQLTSLAVTCTIQAVGRKRNGNSVVQELVYEPKLLNLPAPMQKMNFAPEFTDLIRVDVQLVQAAATSLTVVFFDNNTYVAHF